MSKVLIRARDTFHDNRIHENSGLLHAGKTTVVSEDAAKELEKAGLIIIVGKAKIPTDNQTLSSTEKLTPKEEKVTGPTNKVTHKNVLAEQGKSIGEAPENKAFQPAENKAGFKKTRGRKKSTTGKKTAKKSKGAADLA